MSFDFAEIYRSTRLGLLTLAADLSDAEWMTLAPATPEWTVKDLYGHLTGVAADLLAGNLEIVGSDEWTARQVAARADHSPQEVCAEWTAVGPEVEDRLVAIGSPLSSMVIDVWHHEQDVRNVVDRTANRSGEGLRLSLRAGNAIGPKMEQAGLAALHLHTDGYDREFGVGEAEVTVYGQGVHGTQIVPPDPAIRLDRRCRALSADLQHLPTKVGRPRRVISRRFCVAIAPASPDRPPRTRSTRSDLRRRAHRSHPGRAPTPPWQDREGAGQVPSSRAVAMDLGIGTRHDGG